jgi:LDH2 family malate/lactate/ureidoglycolate dehydrogenase
MAAAADQELDEGARRYPIETLRAFTVEAFTRAGLPEADARTVAENLIQANIRGVESHGITRLLGTYIKWLRAGGFNAHPNFRIERESPSAILVDADYAMGAVAGRWAMDECIRRARQSGACFAGVRNSNHFGASAFFAIRATEADMVGFASTNSGPAMAPTGGVAPYTGTNPICFAVPSNEGYPVVLDMATSVTAKGYVMMAKIKGQETIPAGWALDVRGRPTTSTAEAVAGTLAPVGGHKGYAMSFMVDVLCGVLTGAGFGPHINSLYDPVAVGQGQNTGHLFAAIDISRFMEPARFKERLSQMCAEIRATERAEGVERIYVPGEIEHEKQRTYERDGIPIAEGVRRDFKAVADELGIAFD